MSGSLGTVQAAHLSAQSCDPLVHRSCVEEVHMRKHSSEKAHTTKLRVMSTIAPAQCFGKLLAVDNGITCVAMCCLHAPRL